MAALGGVRPAWPAAGAARGGDGVPAGLSGINSGFSATVSHNGNTGFRGASVEWRAAVVGSCAVDARSGAGSTGCVGGVIAMGKENVGNRGLSGACSSEACGGK